MANAEHEAERPDGPTPDGPTGQPSRIFASTPDEVTEILPSATEPTAVIVPVAEPTALIPPAAVIGPVEPTAVIGPVEPTAAPGRPDASWDHWYRPDQYQAMGTSQAGYPYPQASQPYTGQPYTGQPYTGQPYTGQPYTGQPYPSAQYGYYPNAYYQQGYQYPSATQPGAWQQPAGTPSSAQATGYQPSNQPVAGSAAHYQPFSGYPGSYQLGAGSPTYYQPGSAYQGAQPPFGGPPASAAQQSSTPPRRPRRGLLALTAFLVVTMLGWASFSWATGGLAGGRLAPTQSSADPTTQPTQRSRTQAPQSQATQKPGRVSTETDVVAAMSVGVVLITADTGSGTAAGTGMVIAASGRVLTNYHVVAGSDSVSVAIADSGRSYSATVIGFDQARDVALLQLKNAGGLATVTVDDDQLAVGDEVSAVGNAGGGGELVRANGSVTALSEDLTVSSDSPWGSSEDLHGLVETNARAVPGDSGGPMFDAENEVIGITTAGSTRSSASYAIPIAEALSIVDQIQSGDEAGTVRIGPAGYLGIRVAESRPGEDGATVTEVTKGGPAAKAGLTNGSVLTQVGDTTITGNTNVASVIRALEPGAQVIIEWTDPSGRSRQASVTLGTSPVN